MSYMPPPPATLPPPPRPPRKSRAGGILLLLAGIAAAASPWLPLVTAQGRSFTLQQGAAETASTRATLDNPAIWFYAILAGAGIAILFGLIGLAGNKGVNITAGIFGLLATAVLAFPAVRMITGGAFPTVDLLKVLGAGYYTLAAAALLALIASLTAFIGSRKG